MTTPTELLEDIYSRSFELESSGLELEQQTFVETIVRYAEQQKAVLAVLVTSLTKKLVSPDQDIRLHKAEFEGGYSGRVFDTQYITPFLMRVFPRLAMRSGSGWLTRSLEQAAPFNLQFPGRISSKTMKTSFLGILDDIETNGASSEAYLLELFRQLRQQFQLDDSTIDTLKVDGNITVHQALEALEAHFFHDYGVSGAARLPVVAIHSIYSLLMATPRYQRKLLLPLKSHTTSDIKSRSIGDVEIIYEDGTFFEAVEVKHRIPITMTMVDAAFDKIRSLTVTRYYLLTTSEPNTLHTQEIAERINTILKTHGCEIIVNGVMPSLKYYLRLLSDPLLFLSQYTADLFAEYNSSTDIKRVHIERWNNLNPASSKG